MAGYFLSNNAYTRRFLKSLGVFPRKWERGIINWRNSYIAILLYLGFKVEVFKHLWIHLAYKDYRGKRIIVPVITINSKAPQYYKILYYFIYSVYLENHKKLFDYLRQQGIEPIYQYEEIKHDENRPYREATRRDKRIL